MNFLPFFHDEFKYALDKGQQRGRRKVCMPLFESVIMTSIINCVFIKKSFIFSHFFWWPIWLCVCKTKPLLNLHNWARAQLFNLINKLIYLFIKLNKKVYSPFNSCLYLNSTTYNPKYISLVCGEIEVYGKRIWISIYTTKSSMQPSSIAEFSVVTSYALIVPKHKEQNPNSSTIHTFGGADLGAVPAMLLCLMCYPSMERSFLPTIAEFLPLSQTTQTGFA